MARGSNLERGEQLIKQRGMDDRLKHLQLSMFDFCIYVTSFSRISYYSNVRLVSKMYSEQNSPFITYFYWKMKCGVKFLITKFAKLCLYVFKMILKSNKITYVVNPHNTPLTLRGLPLTLKCFPLTLQWAPLPKYLDLCPTMIVTFGRRRW